MQIEQIDRDAAARFTLAKGVYSDAVAQAIIDGKLDDDEYVQALAAHRLAETERCARVAGGFHIYWQSAAPKIAAAIRGNTNAD